MSDAAILIPTHRHAELLPFAVRSALGQVDADVEVLVVGDGVNDATRATGSGYDTRPFGSRARRSSAT